MCLQLCNVDKLAVGRHPSFMATVPQLKFTSRKLAHADDCAFDHFEYFYDFCVVRALKYRNEALWKVIMASWGIAFFEYCFQVPANRIGSYEFSSAQLKTIQEVITLVVFSVFSVLYLGDKFKWNYAAGFALVAAGSFFIFHKW